MHTPAHRTPEPCNESLCYTKHPQTWEDSEENRAPTKLASTEGGQSMRASLWESLYTAAASVSRTYFWIADLTLFPPLNLPIFSLLSSIKHKSLHFTNMPSLMENCLKHCFMAFIFCFQSRDFQGLFPREDTASEQEHYKAYIWYICCFQLKPEE